MRSVPGDRLPLYCTGVGKAILSLPARGPGPRRFSGPGPLPRINDKTLTDPGRPQGGGQGPRCRLRPRPRGVRDGPDLHGHAPAPPRLGLRRRDQRLRPDRPHAATPRSRAPSSILAQAACDAEAALEAPAPGPSPEPAPRAAPRAARAGPERGRVPIISRPGQP